MTDPQRPGADDLLDALLGPPRDEADTQEMRDTQIGLPISSISEPHVVREEVGHIAYPLYPSYPAPAAEGTPPRPSVAGRGAPVDAYRTALRQWWSLAAQGATADVVEVGRVYQEIVRLLDEVGEPRATAKRRAWARAWYEETGVCPFCGERGLYHDPESAA
jgi:hypothetical protein